MKYRLSFATIALALGLGGCATYSDYYGSNVVYEDGSYYSPADQSQGDYYFAPERDYDPYYYDDYFYNDYWGAPGYFTGYCSVRYRYCPSYGYTPFLSPFPRYGFSLSFGSGWGNYGWGDRWYDHGWYDHWDRYNRRSAPVYRNPPPPRSHESRPPLEVAPAPTREFRRPRQRIPVAPDAQDPGETARWAPAPARPDWSDGAPAPGNARIDAGDSPRRDLRRRRDPAAAPSPGPGTAPWSAPAPRRAAPPPPRRSDDSGEDSDDDSGRRSDGRSDGSSRRPVGKRSNERRDD